MCFSLGLGMFVTLHKQRINASTTYEMWLKILCRYWRNRAGLITKLGWVTFQKITSIWSNELWSKQRSKILGLNMEHRFTSSIARSVINLAIEPLGNLNVNWCTTLIKLAIDLFGFMYGNMMLDLIQSNRFQSILWSKTSKLQFQPSLEPHLTPT